MPDVTLNPTPVTESDSSRYAGLEYEIVGMPPQSAASDLPLFGGTDEPAKLGTDGTAVVELPVSREGTWYIFRIPSLRLSIPFAVVTDTDETLGHWASRYRLPSPVGPVAGPQGPEGPIGPTGLTGPEGPEGTLDIEVYKQVATGTVPATPAGGSYTISTDTTVAPATWTTDLPVAADMMDIFVSRAHIRPATAAADTVTPVWGTPHIAGAQGPTGPAGPQGQKGDKGDQGTTGPAGTDGTDGTDGADGAQGQYDIHVYRNAASTPPRPVGGSYSHVSGVLTPPAGWSTTPSEPVDPDTESIWVSQAHINPATDPDPEVPAWTIPFQAGAHGPPGPEGPQGPKGDKGDQGDTGPAGPSGGVSYSTIQDAPLHGPADDDQVLLARPNQGDPTRGSLIAAAMTGIAERIAYIFSRQNAHTLRERINPPDPVSTRIGQGVSLAQDDDGFHYAFTHILNRDTSIRHVAELPAATADSDDILYLEVDHSTGTRADGVMTIGFLGAEAGYRSDVLGSTAFGAVNKQSPMYDFVGAGDDTSYNLQLISSLNLAWLQDIAAVWVNNVRYTHGDIDSAGQLHQFRLANFPENLHGTNATFNFELTDGSFYLNDASDSFVPTGFYFKIEIDPGSYQYFHIEPTRIFHTTGSGPPEEQPQRDGALYINNAGQLWASAGSDIISTTDPTGSNELLVHPKYVHAADVGDSRVTGILDAVGDGGFWGPNPWTRDDFEQFQGDQASDFTRAPWRDAWSYVLTVPGQDNQVTRNLRDAQWFGPRSSDVAAYRHLQSILAGEPFDAADNYYYSRPSSGNSAGDIRKITAFVPGDVLVINDRHWEGPFATPTVVMEMIDEAITAALASGGAIKTAIDAAVPTGIPNAPAHEQLNTKWLLEVPRATAEPQSPPQWVKDTAAAASTRVIHEWEAFAVDTLTNPNTSEWIAVTHQVGGSSTPVPIETGVRYKTIIYRTSGVAGQTFFLEWDGTRLRDLNQSVGGSVNLSSYNQDILIFMTGTRGGGMIGALTTDSSNNLMVAFRESGTAVIELFKEVDVTVNVP